MDRLVEHRFFAAAQPVLDGGPPAPLETTFRQLFERLWSAPPGFPHLIAADVVELLALIAAATGEETQHLIMQGPRDVTSLTDPLVADALTRAVGKAEGLPPLRLRRRLLEQRRSLSGD